MGKEVIDIIELLKDSTGVDISCFDDSFLLKSIEKRLIVKAIPSLDDYFHYLKIHQKEAVSFLDSLHISFSEFFRNPLTFAYLEQFILPQLLAGKRKKADKEIRIWSAACASGQESYSLAILFDELRENSSEKLDFRIFATDNNHLELSKAQEGTFSAYTLSKVTLKRLNTYFVQQEDHYTVSASLKNQVDFSYFDLLKDQRTCPAPSIYGNFDLVMCSNLLFYYKPACRRRILEKIGHTLAPGGYLVTGETEREILMKYNYQEVFENSAIFRKSDKEIIYGN